jgi:hypothetical protein
MAQQPLMAQQQQIMTQQPLMAQQQQVMTQQPVIPLPTLAPIINISDVPVIPVSTASANALSDTLRAETLKGSIMPINQDITSNAAATILATNSLTDNIVSNIKENFIDFMDNSIKNEKTIRDQASTLTDTNLSQQLLNTADKLAVGRNAVSSIVNNNDEHTNNQLIKSLVKSDILNNASVQASQSNDPLTAQQLSHASLSQSNIANALVQCNVLKSVAQSAQNNGSKVDSLAILNIADTHLEASLNMISYNDNMEKALDSYLKGDYDLSKKHAETANSYLKNNLTLNDSTKGFAVESSKKLYAQIPVMSNGDNNLVPPASRCDKIAAVNISGLEDYEYANF